MSRLLANPFSASVERNLSNPERCLSLAGGAALMLYGLRRGTLGGFALAAVGGACAYRGITGHCDVYQVLGLNTAERRGAATSVAAGAGVKVEKAVTINRSPEELYHYWRNLENLPRFMHNLEEVHQDGNHSHWIAKGPLGTRVEWDAEIINEKPNELIAWRSLKGADVDNAGSVHFEPLPGEHGTEIKVTLKYDPPAGKAGAAAAKLFGQDPEKEIEEDLHHFKQMMEGGRNSANGGTVPSG